MNDALLNIYHRLPPPLRSVAATVRGLYLRSWRYGPDTERLVEEALERGHWDSGRWKNWQEEQLAFVLNRAATRVPFYRSYWESRCRKGDYTSWKCIKTWPILEKEVLRQNLTAFLAGDCNPRFMFHEHTSRTAAIHLTYRGVAIRCGLRMRYLTRAVGLVPDFKTRLLGYLGSQLITPVVQRRSPFWVWNAVLNQLCMSFY